MASCKSCESDASTKIDQDHIDQMDVIIHDGKVCEFRFYIGYPNGEFVTFIIRKSVHTHVTFIYELECAHFSLSLVHNMCMECTFNVRGWYIKKCVNWKVHDMYINYTFKFTHILMYIILSLFFIYIWICIVLNVVIVFTACDVTYTHTNPKLTQTKIAESLGRHSV